MGQNFEFGIRLKADGGSGFIGTVEASEASLKRLAATATGTGNSISSMKGKEDALLATLREKVVRLQKGETGLLRYQAAQIGAAKSAEPLIAKLEELNRKNGSAADSSSRLASSLGNIGKYGAALATFGVTTQLAASLLDTADKMQLLDARLRLVTTGAENFKDVQSSLIAISQANGSALQETAQLYIKLASAGEDYNITQSQALRLTDLMGKSLRVSGATAAESASSMLQFSQALGSGKLGGDEFRAMMESNLVLMKALANGMDVPLGKLKQMAAEGELTTDRIVAALLKSGKSIDEQAQKLDGGLTPAMQRLRNETDLLVKDLDKAFSSSKIVAGGMDLMALAAERLRAKLKVPGGWASILPGPVGGAAAVFSDAAELSTPSASKGKGQSGKIRTPETQRQADLKVVDADFDDFRKNNKLKDQQALEDIYKARVTKLVEFVRFGKLSQAEFLRWEAQFRQDMLGKPSGGGKGKALDKADLFFEDQRLAGQQIEAEQKQIAAALKEVEAAIREQDRAWAEHYELLAKSDDDQLAQLEDMSAAEEARRESLAKEAQALLEVLDPSIKLAETQDRYFQMLSEGLIDQDQFNEAMKRVGESTKEANSIAKDFGITMTSAAEDAIEHWEGFGNLLQKIGVDIEKMLFRRVVTDPLKELVDGALKNVDFGDILPSAKGNAFVHGQPVAFATGGAFTNSIVRKPTMFPLGLMGEKTEEAILPLARDASGNLGVRATGTGGDVTVVSPGVEVNVYEAAGTQATVQQSRSENGALKLDVIVEQLDQMQARMIRRGTSQVGSAMQQTYGLRRVPGA